MTELDTQIKEHLLRYDIVEPVEIQEDMKQMMANTLVRADIASVKLNDGALVIEFTE